MKSIVLSCLAVAAASFSTGCCGPLWTAGCRVGACGGGACGVPLAVGHSACDSGCATGGCGGGCDACDGCGELYIDPWINHPADCCDPCDSCGNFNGQSCGKCRPVFSGIKSLWGYRCVDNCGGCGDCAAGPFNTCGGGGCDGGCSDCQQGGAMPMRAVPMDGMPMSSPIPMDTLEAPLPPSTPLGQSSVSATPGRTMVTRRDSRSNPRLANPRLANPRLANPRPAKPIFKKRSPELRHDPLAF